MCKEFPDVGIHRNSDLVECGVDEYEHLLPVSKTKSSKKTKKSVEVEAPEVEAEDK